MLLYKVCLLKLLGTNWIKVLSGKVGMNRVFVMLFREPGFSGKVGILKSLLRKVRRYWYILARCQNKLQVNIVRVSEALALENAIDLSRLRTKALTSI